MGGRVLQDEFLQPLLHRGDSGPREGPSPGDCGRPPQCESTVRLQAGAPSSGPVHMCACRYICAHTHVHVFRFLLHVLHGFCCLPHGEA